MAKVLPQSHLAPEPLSGKMVDLIFSQSSETLVGWWSVRDYTTQYIGDYNTPIGEYILGIMI